MIWGHILLGYDLTMPSIFGFVSLAGVVVNDSILLVSFAKNRHGGGALGFAEAAAAGEPRALPGGPADLPDHGRRL